MRRERPTLDVSRNSQLLQLAREVKQTRTALILKAEGEDLAEIRPLGRRSRLPAGKRTSPDDPIWNIIGIASTNQRDNISERVDEYLVEVELAKNQTA